jgi:predicted DNA-binding protein (UPF0251 family)
MTTLTLGQAARLAGVSKSTVALAVKAGRLSTTKTAQRQLTDQRPRLPWWRRLRGDSGT